MYEVVGVEAVGDEGHVTAQTSGLGMKRRGSGRQLHEVEVLGAVVLHGGQVEQGRLEAPRAQAGQHHGGVAGVEKMNSSARWSSRAT